MLRNAQHSDRRRKIGGAIFGLLLFCVLAGALFIAAPALAQQEALGRLGAQTDLPNVPISILVARIIRIFLSILGVIATVLIIYGGFLYMTAGGDDAKVKKAKRVLQQTVIGLLIIISSYAITTFILNALLDAMGLGGGVSSVADSYSEPLSGSLGAGIIQDHYPSRNAIDVPRNTLIFVTFKEEINPATIIRGWESGNSGDLHSGNVLIYPTDEGPEAALGDTDVVVGFDETNPTTFVFDPVELLGDGVEDMNYTVVLGPGIEKADETAAFTGSYRDGYVWTFEVSTEVDLTPPTVKSVVPTPSEDAYARNISVEITFSEAMNPVALTGTYDEEGEFFSNLIVTDPEGTVVEGTWEISDGYKTVTLTTNNACGRDPCGDTIYCLPGDEAGLLLTATAVAASVGSDPPQSVPIGISYDGVVDAAGNSLDGNADGIAQGSDSDASESPDVDDNYSWSFITNDDIEDTVPEIQYISPGVEGSDANPDADVEIIFNTVMKSSTLTSNTISLWPDPWYEFWFKVRKISLAEDREEAGLDDEVVATKAIIEHPSMVSTEDGGWDYWPLVTNDVKSAYQICMHPGYGPESGNDSGSCQVTEERPYCCNGSARRSPGCLAPEASSDFGSPLYLPDTNPDTNPILNP
ncbi:MAG: hypothetical protein D6706_01670 [Chloroflexi bacterium]|nr:MAG: hypothetical protein D6706_01670 [Chloroflexota bacterium]